MIATAVVLERPEHLVLSRLALTEPSKGDVVVDILWSGISTGTERLLWSGRMPPFPGLGYPLVPGYESVGRISQADGASGARVGDMVFVPGARCYGEVRGLFGGASSRVVVAGNKVTAFDEAIGADGVLFALAATAHHAIVSGDGRPPDLIVGHGVLGRLVARVALALGHPAPIVWETNADRRNGADGYSVIDPASDARRDYGVICDVSGDAKVVDSLIARLAPQGEIVLAGFYADPIAFAFPPAFMREARLRVAAEWREGDLMAVRDLVATGKLSLKGLITHTANAADASDAYRTAFGDPQCLKMTLDWRDFS